VTDALDLSKETKNWLAQLDALEKCAANPTNPLARRDPSYSANTVATIRSLRAELKGDSAVRFLNSIDETGAGITAVTSVLSVALKPAFRWVDAGLKADSELLMAEATAAVVPCDPPPPGVPVAAGSVSTVWDCTGPEPFRDHHAGRTDTLVHWIWDEAFSGYLVESGTVSFEVTDECIETSGTADIAPNGGLNNGALKVYPENLWSTMGYGYMGGGYVQLETTWIDTCPLHNPPGGGPLTVEWLPPIRGFQGPNDVIEGTGTMLACPDSYVGSSSFTYSFGSLPVGPIPALSQ